MNNEIYTNVNMSDTQRFIAKYFNINECYVFAQHLLISTHL